jgi:TusA-related sulfurtransferase
VHAREVPGTRVMAAEPGKIGYTVERLPRGAALRLRTNDSAAVEAIHEFLAFQRMDHHAGAHQLQ